MAQDAAESPVFCKIFSNVSHKHVFFYLLSVLIYNDTIRCAASLTLVDIYQSVVRKAGSSGPVLR